MLTTIQKKMIQRRLIERIEGLDRYYSYGPSARSNPRACVINALNAAIESPGDESVPLQVHSKVTFFRRNDSHLINEIRGIVRGDFTTCVELDILNNVRDEKSITGDEFKMIQAEFTEYGLKILYQHGAAPELVNSISANIAHN
jgi:hypothetical protein